MGTQDETTGTTSNDPDDFTKEDAKRASNFSIRWLKGASLAEIAAGEGLDVATVERLVRVMMANVTTVTRNEVSEHKGEVRRLRRLMAHVAKGGFGEGVLLTTITHERTDGLQFHNFVVTGKHVHETDVMNACKPHIEALFARIAPNEKGVITHGPVGLDDMRDEGVEPDDPDDDLDPDD